MPLKMLNVASYLPHHIVAVAVVVLASNTSMSKIHFRMLNIGKHHHIVVAVAVEPDVLPRLHLILGDPHANGVQ